MRRLRSILRRLKPPRRLKFTREGRYFVAIAIGIGMAAINTGNNLLYLLLGWLLSVIIASGVLSELTIRGLRVQRRPPGRIFAKQPFLMEISVENRKESLSSYSIEIEDLIDAAPLDKKCYFLKVPPGRVQRTSYRHTLARRGRYCFSGFRIGTKFPFALFRKSRMVADPSEVLAFPPVYPIPVPLPRVQHIGGTIAFKAGRRGEFFGLREYRDGDDRRDIHWRSTARSGRPLVREYEEESQRRATLLVDNALPGLGTQDDQLSQAEAAEALEQAISLAASLAAAYLHKHYGVRLIGRGCHVPYDVGAAHLTRILEALAVLDTVTEEVAFSGVAEPGIESILVIPKGIESLRGRPDASHILHVD